MYQRRARSDETTRLRFIFDMKREDENRREKAEGGLPNEARLRRSRN
ncbi:hypothetical protein HMPREF0762_01780 [Slackia exigua ATCC 700122]|uniref:Uncharacterized protein n=1 Tax=Slackia exigua (strain ATCC 700122 / DSM 15923 / CIP 105133 / JCM 11022 / KCTC 5966 / S-7) TaxID=649764 RepID=D0WIV5_SLAES|nr:hypothetical protein HMPREF0762_01780 [Slackia exigua ATCC 700122]